MVKVDKAKVVEVVVSEMLSGDRQTLAGYQTDAKVRAKVEALASEGLGAADHSLLDQLRLPLDYYQPHQYHDLYHYVLNEALLEPNYRAMTVFTDGHFSLGLDGRVFAQVQIGENKYDVQIAEFHISDLHGLHTFGDFFLKLEGFVEQVAPELEQWEKDKQSLKGAV